MTPHHFNLLADGYYGRLRRQREQLAWALTVIVNHYPMQGKGAKALKIEQLIGLSEEHIRALRKRQLKARQDSSQE